MKCIHERYDQVALDHLKDQTETAVTNKFKKHTKYVSSTTDTSNVISLLKSHILRG